MISMISISGIVAAFAVTGFMQIPYTAANADPATNSLRDYGPSLAWRAKNQPNHTTDGIQASECGMNTRLAFPNVQLYAWFEYNHADDNFHGCPYGKCHAYTTFPQPEDMELDFLNSISFFWYEVGGTPGTGVKLISNPQSGAFGYEESLSGKYRDGRAPPKTLQLQHDSNYPHFNEDDLPKWPKGADKPFHWARTEPPHPKCGRPCEKNKDPGMKPGVYGFHQWAPASAEDYPPPPGWKGQCPSNGTVPATNPCQSFCGCMANCKDDDTKCVDECADINKGKCQKSQCPLAPSPNPPQPGNDPDKCRNFCQCSDKCKDSKDKTKCIKSKCRHISHGCEKDQCQTTGTTNPPPPSTSNPPQSSEPKKKTKGDSGNDSHTRVDCDQYCSCSKKCHPGDSDCGKDCPNSDHCAKSCTNPNRSSRKKIKSCLI